MKIAIPSNAPGGMEAPISPHFGRCEVFTLIDLENGKVTNVSVIQNTGVHEDPGALPPQLLAPHGVNAVIVQGMGPKAMQLFGQMGIAVYVTSAPTVGEAIKEVVEDKAKLASLEDACKEAQEMAAPPPPITPPFGPGMGMGYGMGRGMGRGMGFVPYAPPAAPPSFSPPQVAPPSTGRLRIAVATQGRGGPDDLVSLVFGRTSSFTLVEVEGKEIKDIRVLPNQLVSSPSGVGIAVVQMLANQGVKYIVAGRFGPNASAVANQFGIQMIMVPPGTRVKDAVTQYILKSR